MLRSCGAAAVITSYFVNVCTGYGEVFKAILITWQAQTCFTHASTSGWHTSLLLFIFKYHNIIAVFCSTIVIIALIFLRLVCLCWRHLIVRFLMYRAVYML